MNRLLSVSKGNITIRPVVTAEAALLRELRLEALADTPQAFGADYDSTAAETVEDWEERIQKNMQSQQGIIHVAAVENGLIGMLGIQRGSRPKTQHDATIWGVYVCPGWRGFHIAEALIGAALDWAKAQEIRIAKLGVATTNLPAIRCYARCGFQVYGVDPQVIYYDGVFYDELLMAREIHSV